MHTHKPMHTKRPQLFACLSSRRDSLQTLDCVQNISALIKYIQSESFLSFSSAPHFRRFAEFPSLKLSKTLFQRVVFNSIRSCTALHASSFCTKRTDWVFASPFSMSRSAWLTGAIDSRCVMSLCVYVTCTLFRANSYQGYLIQENFQFEGISNGFILLFHVFPNNV